MSVNEFFAYLLSHEASQDLGSMLAETYSEREHTDSESDLAQTA